MNGTLPPPAGRWQQVHSGYVSRFGPEAGRDHRAARLSGAGREKRGRPRKTGGRLAPEVG